MNAIDLTAQFISTITWEQLPEAVQRKAWICLVDNQGAHAIEDSAKSIGADAFAPMPPAPRVLRVNS